MEKQMTKPQEKPIPQEDYVQRAERVIKGLMNGRSKLTTSQIRNILSMCNQIYNEVIISTEETLSDEVQAKLKYLKVQLVYSAGRNLAVKDFIVTGQLIEELDGIGVKREKFIAFARYMEALVAYHRFYGGRDA